MQDSAPSHVAKFVRRSKKKQFGKNVISPYFTFRGFRYRPNLFLWISSSTDSLYLGLHICIPKALWDLNVFIKRNIANLFHALLRSLYYSQSSTCIAQLIVIPPMREMCNRNLKKISPICIVISD